MSVTTMKKVVKELEKQLNPPEEIKAASKEEKPVLSPGEMPIAKPGATAEVPSDKPAVEPETGTAPVAPAAGGPEAATATTPAPVVAGADSSKGVKRTKSGETQAPPAPSEDRWKPLSDKLAEKGVPEDVAKKVLEFFGAQTKKVKLVEDDIISEDPRGPKQSPELKFTDWLKQQDFGDEINKKIIEALVDISKETKLINKQSQGTTPLANVLNNKMGYTKGRLDKSQTDKRKAEKETTVDTVQPSSPTPQGKFTNEEWEQIKQNPEGWVANIETIKGTGKVPISGVFEDPNGKRFLLYIKKDGNEVKVAPASITGVVQKPAVANEPAPITEPPPTKPEASTKTPTPSEPAAKLETAELSEESKKLYKSLETAPEETLSKILALNGENKTLHGGANDLMAIYKFASPELQSRIKKNVRGASDVISQIPALKQKYSSITPEQADIVLSNVFSEFDMQKEREKKAKVVTKSETVPAPAAPEPAAQPAQSDEETRIKYIKEKIKTAFTGRRGMIAVTELYNNKLGINAGNVVELINKVKEAEDIKNIIGDWDSARIYFKKVERKPSKEEKPDPNELDISKLELGGGGQSSERPLEKDGDDGNDGDDADSDVAPLPAGVPTKRRSADTSKAKEKTSNLDSLKTKAASILEKYAKKEGKGGEDLQQFLTNIKSAKNKVAIIDIFDKVLQDEENKDKASNELDGNDAEQPPDFETSSGKIDSIEQEEELLDPKKLKYAKEKTKEILQKNNVEITPEIEEKLQDGEKEHNFTLLLLLEISDEPASLEAKEELIQALRDYDSKQVKKESLTRPMFVLKEGIFKLNR